MQRHIKVQIKDGSFYAMNADTLPVWFQDKVKRRFVIAEGNNTFKVTTKFGDVRVDDAVLFLDENDKIGVEISK